MRLRIIDVKVEISIPHILHQSDILIGDPTCGGIHLKGDSQCIQVPIRIGLVGLYSTYALNISPILSQ